jgi:hypothetical protein
MAIRLCVCVVSVCAGKYLYCNNVSGKNKRKSGKQAGFFLLHIFIN